MDVVDETRRYCFFTGHVWCQRKSLEVLLANAETPVALDEPLNCARESFRITAEVESNWVETSSEEGNDDDDP